MDNYVFHKSIFHFIQRFECYTTRFAPILSAIGTPRYKLAKFLVPRLSSIMVGEFTLKDSFAFAEEVLHQDSKFFMDSLYVDSLFTNIPLEETINISTNFII